MQVWFLYGSVVDIGKRVFEMFYAVLRLYGVQKNNEEECNCAYIECYDRILVVIHGYRIPKP